jgi:two-component system, NtrC family, response regulator HydG
MSIKQDVLPRILVIDDMFGRTHEGGERNQAREGLCVKYQLQDVTGDEDGKEPGLMVKNPIAEAVFCRAQIPARSAVGDTVNNDLKGCLRTVEAGWYVAPGEMPWSLVLLDLCFYTGRVTKESDRRNPGMPNGRPGDDSPDSYFGLSILQAIQERYPELPVVILSSMSREEVSKQFSTCGALGFLDRVAEESPALLKDYLRRHGLLPDTTGTILGHSKAILLALRSARRMAGSRRNVLIRGPRGSGKGLIAQYIHAISEYRNSNFVPVNLGGANPHLYESLLFGHVKGAFSGADKDRKGFIEEADKGVLFIDEIAGIPAVVQYGLLHVLEDRKVTPLGANFSTEVDVHFISATNEDIGSMAAMGLGFRSDLLDRLREGGTLHVPPLAERKEDIALLVVEFVREAEKHFPGAHARQVAPEAMEKLIQYDWPGNVRELRQCLFKAVSDNSDVEHLVPNHIRLPEMVVAMEASRGKKDNGQFLLHESPTGLRDVLCLLSKFDFSSLSREDLTGQLEEIERACRQFAAHYLRATLEKTLTPVEGNVQITPAMKMATGNTKIKASKAADMIKRLLKGLDSSLLDESILKRAIERAWELRPPR